jgi:hypothetical protein
MAQLPLKIEAKYANQNKSKQFVIMIIFKYLFLVKYFPFVNTSFNYPVMKAGIWLL